MDDFELSPGGHIKDKEVGKVLAVEVQSGHGGTSFPETARYREIGKPRSRTGSPRSSLSPTGKALQQQIVDPSEMKSLRTQRRKSQDYGRPDQVNKTQEGDKIGSLGERGKGRGGKPKSRRASMDNGRPDQVNKVEEGDKIGKPKSRRGSMDYGRPEQVNKVEEDKIGKPKSRRGSQVEGQGLRSQRRGSVTSCTTMVPVEDPRNEKHEAQGIPRSQRRGSAGTATYTSHSQEFLPDPIPWSQTEGHDLAMELLEEQVTEGRSPRQGLRSSRRGSTDQGMAADHVGNPENDTHEIQGLRAPRRGSNASQIEGQRAPRRGSNTSQIEGQQSPRRGSNTSQIEGQGQRMPRRTSNTSQIEGQGQRTPRGSSQNETRGVRSSSKVEIEQETLQDRRLALMAPNSAVQVETEKHRVQGLRSDEVCEASRRRPQGATAISDGRNLENETDEVDNLWQKSLQRALLTNYV